MWELNVKIVRKLLEPVRSIAFAFLGNITKNYESGSKDSFYHGPR